MLKPKLDYQEELTRIAERLDEQFPGPFALLICEPVGVDAEGNTTSVVHRIHNFSTDEEFRRLLAKERQEGLNG